MSPLYRLLVQRLTVPSVSMYFDAGDSSDERQMLDVVAPRSVANQIRIESDEMVRDVVDIIPSLAYYIHRTYIHTYATL